MHNKHYDVFIIGGGVNGCGLARDAAGRGYKTGLAEMNDLASGTSSASTKLIHGGLRYLEQYAFRLVREALTEREIIWRLAPHIVQPLRFLLPYSANLRPKWLLRMGLFLYDHLGGRKDLPATRSVHLHQTFENPLKDTYNFAFEYSDARVDDARLVVLNARHAAKLGADIFVQTKVIGLKAEQPHSGKGQWRITLHNKKLNKTYDVTANYLVNMAGPWINNILQDALNFEGHPPIRLVQGSHIVVKKLYDHDRAYIFQNKDNRIIFAIPYYDDFTLLGTTDQDYHGDLQDITITKAETDYLLSAASEYFKKPISNDMIIWRYSGVRPLYDDGASKAQEATRDYVLKEMSNLGAPLLNSYGGKITTYRRLAEDAMEYIEKSLGARAKKWTKSIALPGGDFSHLNLQVLEKNIANCLPELDATTHKRLLRSYGTDVLTIFSHGKSDKGIDFGNGLYEVEVKWLMKEEWALTAEDILWRRSKLGLYFNEKQTLHLQNYMEANQDKVA